MPGFEVSETIERAPSAVWRAMMDPGCWARVIEGLEKIEPLEAGATRLGSRFSETRTLGGRTETFIVEVTEFEEGSRYGASVFYQGAEFRYSYALEELEGGGRTRVTMRASVIGRSWVARTLLRPVLGITVKMMKKHDGDQLSRLREVVEGMDAGAGGPGLSGGGGEGGGGDDGGGSVGPASGGGV